jgi:hypothetical protein
MTLKSASLMVRFPDKSRGWPTKDLVDHGHRRLALRFANYPERTVDV